MPIADYRCAECDRVIELDTTCGEQTHAVHPKGYSTASCIGTLRRVWSPPRLGAGSSGEPAR